MGSRVGGLTLPGALRSLVHQGWADAGHAPPPDLLACGRAAGSSTDRSTPVPPEGPSRRGGSALEHAQRLGVRYEQLLEPEARSAGAHYTPADVALHLVRRVVEPVLAPAVGDGRPAATPPTVWDPACGGGAFLLAAAEVLLDAGHAPAEIIEDLLWGTDTDPGAVAVAEASLVLWATLHGAPEARPGDHLEVADSLAAAPPLARGFRFVVGNPPFQGQLAGGSVRTRTGRELLRQRWGDVVGPYTDTSTLFAVAGAAALEPGGRLGMILPTSVLAARDAEPARQRLAATTDLVGLWVALDQVFAASVEVCAPILQRRSSEAPAPTVARWRRRTWDDLPAADGQTRSWSALALAAHDVPVPDLVASGSLGDLAVASSGFRDEYYGLAGHVVEAGDRSLDEDVRPLVTSGLIEPGRCRWGEHPVRFAKRRFERPVVDVAALQRSVAANPVNPGARAAGWVASTLGPKVVVATQTRVGEAAVDHIGLWVPSTPTIVVRPTEAGATALPGPSPTARLWALAAVVCSPVGTVSAMAHTFGSARSIQAIKPSARSVLALPVPVDRDAWAAGAAALEAGERAAFADAMGAAYGVPPGHHAALVEWWSARVPW